MKTFGSSHISTTVFVASPAHFETWRTASQRCEVSGSGVSGTMRDSAGFSSFPAPPVGRLLGAPSRSPNLSDEALSLDPKTTSTHPCATWHQISAAITAVVEDTLPHLFPGITSSLYDPPSDHLTLHLHTGRLNAYSDHSRDHMTRVSGQPQVPWIRNHRILFYLRADSGAETRPRRSLRDQKNYLKNQRVIPF